MTKVPESVGLVADFARVVILRLMAVRSLHMAVRLMMVVQESADPVKIIPAM